MTSSSAQSLLRALACLLFLAMVPVAAAGCDDDEGGGDPLVLPPGDGDGDGDGDGGGDEDAGALDEDAGTTSRATCKEVAALTGPGAGGEGLTSTSAPADFEVRRVNTVYDCDQDEFVISLSGGLCPIGNGHELSLRISTDAIAAGRILAGVTTVDDTLDDALAIAYTRTLGSLPSGEWGNCGRGSVGTLNLADAPDLGRRDTIEGGYDLELPPCGDTTGDPWRVTGYFVAEMRDAFADSCP